MSIASNSTGSGNSSDSVSSRTSTYETSPTVPYLPPTGSIKSSGRGSTVTFVPPPSPSATSPDTSLPALGGSSPLLPEMKQEEPLPQTSITHRPRSRSPRRKFSSTRKKEASPSPATPDTSKRVFFENHAEVEGTENSALLKRTKSLRTSKKPTRNPTDLIRAGRAGTFDHLRTQSTHFSPLRRVNSGGATTDSIKSANPICSSPSSEKRPSRSSVKYPWKNKRPKNLPSSFPVKSVRTKCASFIEHVNSSWFSFITEEYDTLLIDETAHDIATLKPALIEMEHFDPWSAVLWLLIKKFPQHLKSVQQGSNLNWETLKWKTEKLDPQGLTLKFQIPNHSVVNSNSVENIIFNVFVTANGTIGMERLPLAASQ